MERSAEVDRYIAGFPKEVARLLEQLRQTIEDAAPDAREVISYRMPAYKQNGILAYFAGYKNFFKNESIIALFSGDFNM